MKPVYLISIALLLIIISLFGSVQGIEEPGDPVVTETETRQVGEEVNSSSEEDKSIWETIEEGIGNTITRLFEVFLAPFEAIAQVFKNWGDTVSGPLGLLIAGGVLFCLYLLIRFSGMVDMFLDRLN